MPYFFITAGILLLIVGTNPSNNMHELATTIENDLTGSGGFGKWLVVIALVGSIGFLPGMSDVSTAFLVLCVIVFILANNGVFAKAEAALS